MPEPDDLIRGGPTEYPVAPDRIVVLPARPTPADAELIQHGHAILRRTGPLWDGAASLWQGWPFVQEKADLMIRLIDAMARHYDRPDVFASWLRLCARREALGSTGIGRNLAMLDFLGGPTVSVDNPPLDWWLFLVPQGTFAWESLDDEPVRLITGLARGEPDTPGPRLRMLEWQSITLRRVTQSGWERFPWAGPIRIARYFNRHAAEAWEDIRRRNRQ